MPAPPAPLLAYEPFGQQKLYKHSKQYKQQIHKCREDPLKWPDHVPSFELWATATKYEQGAADGGEAFHKMMRLLLVDSNNSKVNVVAAKRHVKQHKRAGNEWHAHDAQDVHSVDCGNALHTPKTQGKLSTTAGASAQRCDSISISYSIRNCAANSSSSQLSISMTLLP